MIEPEIIARPHPKVQSWLGMGEIEPTLPLIPDSASALASEAIPSTSIPFDQMDDQSQSSILHRPSGSVSRAPSQALSQAPSQSHSAISHATSNSIVHSIVSSTSTVTSSTKTIDPQADTFIGINQYLESNKIFRTVD